MASGSYLVFVRGSVWGRPGRLPGGGLHERPECAQRDPPLRRERDELSLIPDFPDRAEDVVELTPSSGRHEGPSRIDAQVMSRARPRPSTAARGTLADYSASPRTSDVVSGVGILGERRQRCPGTPRRRGRRATTRRSKPCTTTWHSGGQGACPAPGSRGPRRPPRSATFTHSAAPARSAAAFSAARAPRRGRSSTAAPGRMRGRSSRSFGPRTPRTRARDGGGLPGLGAAAPPACPAGRPLPGPPASDRERRVHLPELTRQRHARRRRVGARR